ncbi:MAG: hypothetical protein GX660_04335 [Clostridiaceae bacterium]|nr:hypothetical protein [Clostridiaceae bacterium]
MLEVLTERESMKIEGGLYVPYFPYGSNAVTVTKPKTIPKLPSAWSLGFKLGAELAGGLVVDVYAPGLDE